MGKEDRRGATSASTVLDIGDSERTASVPSPGDLHVSASTSSDLCGPRRLRKEGVNKNRRERGGEMTNHQGVVAEAQFHQKGLQFHPEGLLHLGPVVVVSHPGLV